MFLIVASTLFSRKPGLVLSIASICRIVRENQVSLLYQNACIVDMNVADIAIDMNGVLFHAQTPYTPSAYLSIGYSTQLQALSFRVCEGLSI